jgi:predicted transcriptional regulator
MLWDMTATIITGRADVARVLRTRRLAVGLTQRELAAAAGCSLTWLANIEAGCVPTQSEALKRIRQALAAAEREAAS